VALLFDVDGTLAPIVAVPEAASVPDATRELLVGLKGRYALVACLSGRRGADARRVVGVDSLTYIGNHGLEYLAPGSPRAETVPAAASHAPAVRSFATAADTPELRQAGVRLEDKEAIWAFHWRQAPDEGSARGILDRVAEAASREGLVPHWGRKVLEIRPPVAMDKGIALARLLRRSNHVEAALYAGDDTTDLDAFRKLNELRSSGELTRAVCIGVRSDEGPEEIAGEADLVVEGPSGLRELLALL
jgi:trehalose 6-phosphate phosphatase